MTVPTPEPAPHPIHAVRLRLWLPMVVIGVSLLAFAVLLFMEWRAFDNNLQRFAHVIARDKLLHNQRDLEAVIRRGDGTGADGVVTELPLDPTIDRAVLVDDNNQVLSSTRLAWKGKAAATVVPEWPADLIEQARTSQREVLDLSITQRRLLALAPVALALRPGQVRAQRQGVLLIVFDLTPLVARTWGHFRAQALFFCAVVLTLAAVVLWSLRQRVLQPMQALRQAMQGIGQGDFSHLPQWRGRGDFQQLGQALQDMAHQLQTQRQALQESEARFRQLADAAFECVLLHEKGTIIDANTPAEQLMGVPPGGLIGRSFLSLIAPHDRESVQQRIMQGVVGSWAMDVVDAAGTTIPTECNVRERPVGHSTLRTVAVRDIRQRLAAEAEIRQLALFDALCGLPNRRNILDKVREELAEAELHPRRAALATFNLDAFQSINDSLGMATGDAVLRAVARRLNPLLQQGQTLARVDGDTYALLICNLHGDLETASALAARSVERLLMAITEPLEVDGHTLHLSAGAGVVMIPNDSRDPPELLREAETAMHKAKASTGNRVYFFAHELQEAASARLALRTDLKRALGLPDQLLLHYQPQISAQGELIGVEALARWQHPVRGLVSPIHFIPEAEASGLIVPLGQWVLKEAARCLQRWRQAQSGQPWAQNLSMAVNVSPRQFREADFVQRVQDVVGEVGIDAVSLELELTESVVAEDLEATLEKMEELRCLGVRFALDDFGTGYSSLAYLKRLPIDTLKIDRSFVMDIDAPAQPHTGKRPAVLIEAIVAMAHQLDLRVLAEGVETPAQLERLRHAGCDIFQGYHFSRPLHEVALRNWAMAHARQA